MSTTTATRTARWARRLAAVAVTVAVASGLTAPAQAYIPPSPSTYAGTAGATVHTMSCYPGTIYLWPTVAVQPGYYDGQYVSYRYALWSTTGVRGATSGWSSPTFVPYATTSFGATTLYSRSPLPTAIVPAQRGAAWEVAVQVGWSVPGRGWVYSGWSSPERFQTGLFSPLPRGGWVSCTT